MTDTHAHYDDPAFDADRNDAITSALKVSDIIINAGISDIRSESTVALAEKYDRIYAAVGIHPQHSGDLSVIERLCAHEKVIAVGETGLDYRNADNAEKQRQRELFTAQIEIAKKYNLPLIIHCVDAWGDMLSILCGSHARGVLHGFTGSAETALTLVRQGFCIGFGGRITYPGAKRANAALRAIPKDRILTETDAPYAPPAPYFGRRCEGYMMRDTVSYISRSLDCDESIFEENAVKLFFEKEGSF